MQFLYNRDSYDRYGKPYPGSEAIVWWDKKSKRWAGWNVPDVGVLTGGGTRRTGSERSSVSRHRGMLQYLGWTLVARYLHRVVKAFGDWRDEEYWPR